MGERKNPFNIPKDSTKFSQQLIFLGGLLLSKMQVEPNWAEKCPAFAGSCGVMCALQRGGGPAESAAQWKC